MGTLFRMGDLPLLTRMTPDDSRPPQSVSLRARDDAIQQADECVQRSDGIQSLMVATSPVAGSAERHEAGAGLHARAACAQARSRRLSA